MKFGMPYCPTYHVKSDLFIGDKIMIDFSSNNFYFVWMAARIHVITGLNVSSSSEPFGASIGSGSSSEPITLNNTGAGAPFTPISGARGMMGVSSRAGDIVTITTPATDVEQYSFNNIGHAGYLFKNYTTPIASNHVLDFSISGTSPRVVTGTVIHTTTTPVLGAVVGSADTHRSNFIEVPLTANVPTTGTTPATCLAIAIAIIADNDRLVSDAQQIPIVTDDGGGSPANVQRGRWLSSGKVDIVAQFGVSLSGIKYRAVKDSE